MLQNSIPPCQPFCHSACLKDLKEKRWLQVVAQVGRIAGPACDTQTSQEVRHALMESLPLARPHGLQWRRAMWNPLCTDGRTSCSCKLLLCCVLALLAESGCGSSPSANDLTLRGTVNATAHPLVAEYELSVPPPGQ